MAQISLLQWTSRRDWSANKDFIEQQLEQLKGVEKPHLVILPEAFSRFGAGESAQGRFAETFGQGEVQSFISECAAKYQVWILAGTLPIDEGERYAAASLLFDDQGKLHARYDKIHLFDADVDDETKSYRESKYTRPGKELVVVETPFGRLGLAVCYDLRFPEQFRALRQQGAELIALPSAFTKVTGAAHWQALIQARAIENQVYLLAPNQTGRHDDGRETWGHSMVVDPWGRVVAELDREPGSLTIQADLEELHALRQRMRVQQHNQFEVRFIEDTNASR
ncbi:MAG: carbon-nitrogen hydrolase family protein [Aliidiomarina sp.]|uniref:carbon-nitrogen hydrolase family protein n=1 Tax=Aliidiomarina sp. TaxID=1872439 RepID=UPI0025BE62B6|nr:carbon-nitrogen hydrolase family protein [Aliidiomarina sp.]MCH8501240.1 carbon-nitrogen hydrolase family protein [Aliidiomarina sp.]